jgi:hypothetical protein
MTLPVTPDANVSRKAALAQARQSRRPSRLGMRAGAAAKVDYPVEDDAGFPGLLKQVWRQAAAAGDLSAAVDTLLTLDGHVLADIQLQALRIADECALRVWRSPEGEPTAFLGEIGLNTSGRVVIRTPSQSPLPATEKLVGGVLRMPWSASMLSEYEAEVNRAFVKYREEIEDCRQWLAAAGQDGRREMLEVLKEAARRTAPFVLYHEDRQYTNFRDRNTITGKTLWPGHPDCTLSSLQAVPLELWSDADVVVVVCLTLLVRSVGFARIEEANGTQLTLGHVAGLLERTRLSYGAVAPAASSSVAALNELAVALASRRREIFGSVQLYREIHGPLMHKIERVAGGLSAAGQALETALCARLRDRLPVSGDSLGSLGAPDPEWLVRPHGEYDTGLESLIYETVSAATSVFDADFAMSRGLRPLGRLISMLRAREWAELTKWELPYFFCCVVPAPQARRHFDDSAAHLADVAWAMSSRMQYNSWHFLVGNLPPVPEVVARDFFVPPTIPDIAYYSDMHHHGHVAAKVRFSIRSPQAVSILGEPFRGFVDLRLLRCDGTPFGEQDLLVAHRTSAFVASATAAALSLAAGAAGAADGADGADGADLEIKSFDSRWHWSKIAG